MQEIRKKARELMQGYCRVCPVCDGRACAGEVPGMGGIGSGASFQDNVQSLVARKLNLRVLHQVEDPETRVEFLGISLDFPVLAAPIGGVSFNMGGQVTEEAYIQAILKGCVQKKVLGCVGDGVPDNIHQAGYAVLESIAGQGIPFIKPWEDRELFAKLDMARAAGCSMFGIDVDAAGLVTLSKMGRPVGPKTAAKWRQVKDSIQMKMILKGIMTEDEAKLALDAGADAIVVSNHGGRVLEHAPGVARVLPRIARAVKGRIGLLADGGVRSGGDVLKMLALGADAVMIGRPLSIAAMGGLQEGVVKYLEGIKQELVQCMVLTGCTRAADVPESVLYPDAV